MENQRQILKRYQHADFSIRLNMYLFHPELRDEFTRIDSKDSGGTSRSEKPNVWRMPHLIRRLLGSLL